MAERAFSRVYAERLWGNAGKGAGPGSTPEATQALSALLAHVVLKHNISSLLDVPCGAMAWQPRVLSVIKRLRSIDGLSPAPRNKPRFRYTGVDVVPSIVEEDTRRFPELRFVHADVTDATTFIPRLSAVGGQTRFDLVLTRALFYHLSNARILSALQNIKATGSTWLLATTHNVRQNVDNASWLAGERHGLDEGGFRPVNLRLPPFNLPPPRWQVADSGGEHVGAATQGQSQMIALWRLSELHFWRRGTHKTKRHGRYKVQSRS